MMYYMFLAAETTTTSPWWGVPVVAGSFAIGGALVSAAVSHAQAKRQHNLRWEKDLRAASREFLSLVRVELQHVLKARRGSMRPSAAGYGTRNAALAGFTELSFIAPEGVVSAAWSVLTSLRRFSDAYYEGGNGVDALERLGEEHVQEVRHFRAEVRKALGLPTKLPELEGESFKLPQRQETLSDGD